MDEDRMEQLFDGDEVREVLEDTFYKKGRRRRRRTRASDKATPDHYKVICISMYTTDLARVDAMVKRLKKSGHRKMSRSALIRFALDQVDLSKLPRSY